MSFSRLVLVTLVGLLLSCALCGAQSVPPSSSSSVKHVRKPAAPIDSQIEPGGVINGLYHNKTLGLSCKIPAGWVLRTEEMDSPQGTQGNTEDRGGRVLLAAFSRPPEAHGEEVNSTIVIAAEPQSDYPGLKDAAQYFGPLTEVARAQGFAVDEDPYEVAIGTKTVVRGDFHKDVGSRVMRQSTLAFLTHGYAVSITVIGGTEDEVEELLGGVGFVK